MKKVFSLMLLLATMLAFTACSGDDDEPKTDDSKQLIGTWVCEKSTNDNSFGITISIESVFVFNSNNTFRWEVNSKMDDQVLNSTGLHGTYSYKPNTLTLSYDGKSEEITCIVNGNTMNIVTSEGNSMTHYKK